MNTRKLALWLAILALTLVPLGTALAKEIGLLTISGPGLDKPIEITDRATLLDLGESLFLLGGCYGCGDTPPAWINSETPYFEISRSFTDGSKVMATDHLRYYPASDGGKGAIFYLGMEDPGFSSEANKWYSANPTGEAALLAILRQHGATLPAAKAAQPQAEIKPAQPDVKPAQVEAAPAAPAPAAPPIPWTLIGGATALVMLLAGVVLWLRRLRQAPLHN